MADGLAKDAAVKCRNEKYENPDKGLDSWDVQLSRMREAARLVYGIDKLFPANKPKNGPGALKPRAVPRQASSKVCVVGSPVATT